MKTLIKKSKLSLVMIALFASVGFGSTSALAGDTASVAVSANVLGNCKFTVKTGTVSFTLDPASTADAPGTVTQPVFWCTKGTTYNITDNDGANASGGAQRLKHASLAEFIPYSFAYTATGAGTGPALPIILDIASSVVNADYVNASAGAYADTVTLTITP